MLDLMAAAIPYGQFVGGLVGGCFWVLVAIWLLYFWPRLVRRKMARGELDGNEAEAKLKKTAILGYLFTLIAVCDIITTLSQAGYFGESILSPLIMVGLAITWVGF